MSSENSDVVVFDTKKLDVISKFNTKCILNDKVLWFKFCFLTSAYERNVKNLGVLG